MATFSGCPLASIALQKNRSAAALSEVP